MSNVWFCSIAQLFECMNKLDKSCEALLQRVLLACLLPMRVLGLFGETHNLNVVLEVDEDHELFEVVNEDAATYRPVLINAGGIKVRVSLDLDSGASQPGPVALFEPANWNVLSVELSKDLDNLSLDLKFCLFSHQGCERHTLEVSAG